jgi:hypothetical protein
MLSISIGGPCGTGAEVSEGVLDDGEAEAVEDD